MKISAPKLMTYFLAVAILIVGIIARFVPNPVAQTNAFWIVVVSDVLLIIGCSIKGF